MKKRKKKKRNGFTLIELLAVILILGIIALIAIPTVSSVVNQAREGAKKTTISNYIKAVDEYIMMQELSGEKIPDGIYTFNDFIDKVDIKGDISGLDGTIIISSNSVENYFINDGEKTFTEKDSEVVIFDKKEKGNSTLVFNYPDIDKNGNPFNSLIDSDLKENIANIYLLYDYVPKNYHNVISLSTDNKINGYFISKNNNMYDLIISSENNIITPDNSSYLFSKMINAEKIVLDNLDTSKSRNLSYMFVGNKKLEEVDVTKINTNSATNISYMFFDCEVLKIIDVSKWDTSNVTNINQMFHTARSIKTIDISNWNSDNLLYAEWLFAGASSLEEIKGLDKLDVSRVKKISGMFTGTKIKELTLNFNTQSATNMTQMFRNMSELTVLDISTFDTSNVTNFDEVFNSNPKLVTIYVGNKWNTSKVETSVNMFGAPNLVGAVKYTTSQRDISMANWESGYLTLRR